METPRPKPTPMMGESRRRNSEQGIGRRGSSRRNSRNSRRKSGPKSYDVECVRAGGKQNRRRLSNGLRRRSKDSRASVRRLSLERRPPAFPNPIAKVGGATTPRASSTTARHRGFGWGNEQAEGGGLGAVEEMICVEEGEKEGKPAPPSPGGPEVEEEEEEEEEGSSHWTPEMVSEAARGVAGGDRVSQLRYMKWLRTVLSLSDPPPAAEAVNAGLVQVLVGFLRTEDFPEVLPEALCSLTNIASTEYTKAVTEEPDAVATVVMFLRHSDPYLREQSAWCLGNIAGDCPELRDLVLEAGAMDGLVLNITNPASPSMVRTGSWALANFCRGLPPPPLMTVAQVLPIVRPVLSSTASDPAALIDSAWVLYHVTRGGGDRIDAVLSAGLLTKLPDLLLHENPEVVKPVIRTMDNMACSSGSHRGALIAAGVLDPLLEVLGHDSSKVRADALRLVSCIAAGSADQVAAVASAADIIPSVIAELEEGNSACRREAAWVFLNMCQCGYEPHESLIPSMVEHGLIAAICQNLDAQEEVDNLVVMLVLLYTILDEGGRGSDGEAQLENYMTLVEESNGFGLTIQLMNEHEDMEIYDKGLDIVNSFVDESELDGASLDSGDKDDSEDEDEDEDRDNDVDQDINTITNAYRKEGGRSRSNSEISDDSLLSDDSFHPELSDAVAMPLTASELHFSDPRPPLHTMTPLPNVGNTVDNKTYKTTYTGSSGGSGVGFMIHSSASKCGSSPGVASNKGGSAANGGPGASPLHANNFINNSGVRNNVGRGAVGTRSRGGEVAEAGSCGVENEHDASWYSSPGVDKGVVYSAGDGGCSAGVTAGDHEGSGQTE